MTWHDGRCAFTVAGRAYPQGSKAAIAAGVLREMSKGLKQWRSTVAFNADQERRQGAAFTGPVKVTAVFHFDRPARHYGTGRNRQTLRAAAPADHAQKPDLDKLTRGLGDALTMGGLIDDDALVVSWVTRKRWAAAGTEARTVILVEPYTCGED